MKTLTNVPPEVALELYRNDDFARRIVLKDSDGVPLDVAGWVVTVQIRKKLWKPGQLEADNPTLVEFDVTNEGSGTFLLELDSEDTTDLPNSCFWDVQTDELGTIIRGAVTVVGDVSRV